MRLTRPDDRRDDRGRGPGCRATSTTRPPTTSAPGSRTRPAGAPSRHDRPAIGAMARLASRIEAVDSMLCVGPRQRVRAPAGALRALRPRPQLDFNRAIIDQTADLVAAYKPNLAFYEARGADGWDELAETLAVLRAHDARRLHDRRRQARRTSRSTNEAYAAALLRRARLRRASRSSRTSGARPCGRSSIAPSEAASILCRTSDPGSGELQDLPVDGEPLWEVVARHVRDEWDEHGNCMLVVGRDRSRRAAPRPRALPGRCRSSCRASAPRAGRSTTSWRPASTRRAAACSSTPRAASIFADDPRRAALRAARRDPSRPRRGDGAVERLVSGPRGILVVGGGGREHAICWKLAPGPAGHRALRGTRQRRHRRARDARADRGDRRRRHRGLGGDASGPTSSSSGRTTRSLSGIVDALDAARIPAIGPTAAAARIESSKAWAADVLSVGRRAAPARRGVLRARPPPTTRSPHVGSRPGPLVVKADGLARGKGVVVCDTAAEAVAAIERIGRRRELGRAGERLVIQERLEGPELSVFAHLRRHRLRRSSAALATTSASRMATADRTPAAWARSRPSPRRRRAARDAIERDDHRARRSPRWRAAAAHSGASSTPGSCSPRPARASSSSTRDSAIRRPRSLLPRLRARPAGRYAGSRERSSREPAGTGGPRAPPCASCMASGGYPGDHESGMVIEGLGTTRPWRAGLPRGDHARGRRLVTSGGRVLGVTGLGADVAEARDRAYAGRRAGPLHGRRLAVRHRGRHRLRWME